MSNCTNMRVHHLVSRIEERGLAVELEPIRMINQDDWVWSMTVYRGAVVVAKALVFEIEPQGYELYVETPYLTIQEDAEYVAHCASYHEPQLPEAEPQGA